MLANSPTIASNLNFIADLFSMAIVASRDNRSCDIEDLRNFFINFNKEKLLSPDVTDTGNVKIICNATATLGAKSYLVMNRSTSNGGAFVFTLQSISVSFTCLLVSK
jgi:hypothetical protein